MFQYKSKVKVLMQISMQIEISYLKMFAQQILKQPGFSPWCIILCKNLQPSPSFTSPPKPETSGCSPVSHHLKEINNCSFYTGFSFCSISSFFYFFFYTGFSFCSISSFFYFFSTLGSVSVVFRLFSTFFLHWVQFL